MAQRRSAINTREALEFGDMGFPPGLIAEPEDAPDGSGTKIEVFPKGSDGPFREPTADREPPTLGPDPETESGPVGNTDRGRDLQPPSNTPNTFGLPQGVSVQDALGGTQSIDTPGMSMSPNPVAAQTPNPAFNGTQGPTRRNPSNPAIFAQSDSPNLYGRAGGLLGGGLGAVGQSEPSGPLQPTELFQRLLQLMMQQ